MISRSMLTGAVLCTGFLAGLFSSVSAADAAGAVFRRTSDGATVPEASVEAVLARSGVAAHLPAGAAWTVYAVPVHATDAALLFVTTSSEFVTIADLHGRARVDGRHSISPGQAAVLAVASGEIVVRAFDASRLAASAAPGVAAEFNKALAPVIADQQRGRFWGRFQPINLNTQTPAPQAIEGVRRDYLLEPAIVRLRKDAHGDAKKRSTLAAERLVSALANRNAADVAALIDPLPFTSAGAGWSSSRDSYAHSLVDSGLDAKLSGAAVLAGSAPGSYTVAAGGQHWNLQTVERDGTAFVSSLERQQ